jgi:Mrr N-terminal domain/TIR domain
VQGHPEYVDQIMAIPTFDAFLRPFLAVLASGPPLPTREVQRQIQASSGLTADELAQRLPSSKHSIVENRIAWAQMYLFKAELIERVKLVTYQISPAGREFLAKHPGPISLQTICAVSALKVWLDKNLARASATEPDKAIPAEKQSETPVEKIARGKSELRAPQRAERSIGEGDHLRLRGYGSAERATGLEGETREIDAKLAFLDSSLADIQVRIAEMKSFVHEQFTHYFQLSHEPSPMSPDKVDAHFENIQQSLPLMESLWMSVSEGQAEVNDLLKRNVALQEERAATEMRRLMLPRRMEHCIVVKQDAAAHAQSRPAIFISYSSKDEAIAAELCRVVEQAKFPCWYSGRDLKPGTAGYASRITEAIDESWIVFILLSKHSLASGHVANELEHATGAKKGLLPVEIESFREELTREFKYHLGRYQRLKFPLADGELVKTIERLWDEHA